jgi:predicted RNA-binding protein with PIN domain
VFVNKFVTVKEQCYTKEKTMILIIDAYNLLKQIFPGVKNTLDKQKTAFIKQLAYYKVKKGDNISQIIVVFDAGPSNHATREIKSGIVVVYSGVRSSADNWILNFVERNKGQEILAVTSDRELRESCKKLNADSICVYEFYNILQQNILHDLSTATPEPSKTSESIEKYEPIELDEIYQTSIDSKALDLLNKLASKFKNTKMLIGTGKKPFLERENRIL